MLERKNRADRGVGHSRSRSTGVAVERVDGRGMQGHQPGSFELGVCSRIVITPASRSTSSRSERDRFTRPACRSPRAARTAPHSSRPSAAAQRPRRLQQPADVLPRTTGTESGADSGRRTRRPAGSRSPGRSSAGRRRTRARSPAGRPSAADGRPRAARAHEIASSLRDRARAGSLKYATSCGSSRPCTLELEPQRATQPQILVDVRSKRRSSPAHLRWPRRGELP